MSEINDANQQIEVAKANLTESGARILSIDDRCERLRSLLFPVVSQITAELVREAQTQTTDLREFTAQTEEGLSGSTLDSVVAATKGTPNENAINARTYAQQAGDDFSSEVSRFIIGPGGELRDSLEKMLVFANDVLGKLAVLHQAQDAARDIIGNPSDSLEPALPKQRADGEYGTFPTLDPIPGLIPAALRSLTQLQQDL